MRKRAPSDVSDYWEIFLRRRWWILVTPLVIIAATLAVVSKLPKVYRSQTLILVEPQKVPADYIKPTVSINVTDQLQTITQEVMSRTRLQKIIDQFGLYRNKPVTDRVLSLFFRQNKLTQEDLIEQMRKDITVDPVVDEQARDHPSLSAFKIAYQGSDPALVQQVTRELASLYIEENLRAREQQAEGTHEFIDSELEKARQDLESQEKRLRDFKAQHMGTLPEQQQANLQVLGQLQAVLQANGDAVARAQDQKTYLESLLSAFSNRAPAETKSVLQSELEARRADLRIAEQKYRSDFPDVVRLRGDVKALEEMSADLDKSKSKSDATTNSAPPDQIQSQLAALSQEIKQRTQRQAEIEDKIKEMQARVETLPTVEQQLSEISRDYTISKANYQSLLEKKDASAMAAEMERRAQGEQFRILDPASFPEKPYKPDVQEITLLGCLGGVLFGCVLGLLMEHLDKGIHNEKDAAFYLSPPTLASVPVIAATELKKGSSDGKPTSKSTTLGLHVESLEPQAVPAESRPPADPTPEGTPGTDLIPEQLTHPEVGPGGSSEKSILGHAFRRALAMQASQKPQRPSSAAVRCWNLEDPPGQLVVRPHRSSDQNNAFAREQFRVVRTRLVELMRVRTIRTLMVTSAVEGEGKTLVATNLAFAMSNLEGLKVLLVDADLQKAHLGHFLGIKPEVGLSSYLQNGKGLSDVRWQISGSLAVVPTLGLGEQSAELLNGHRMRSFLEQALREYDLIVVDAPPLLPVADAQVLTSMVDAAILVVRARYCPYDLARSAAELLQPKAIGVVLNAVERFPRKRYYDGYYRKAGKQE